MTDVLLMAGPQDAQGGAGAFLPMLVMWGLIIGIFYFLMIRPQQKKQRELAQMLENLKQGDKVLTSGGIYGSIIGVKGNVAVLKVADQVKIEVAKAAITAVVEKSREA